MRKGDFEIEVLIHGKSAREYTRGPEAWIEGRQGTEFSIRLRNHSGRQVLGVLTVDGRNAIDGERGSVRGGGYVLGPYSDLKVPGWRLDNDQVAKFFFTDKSGAYAVQRGNGESLGTIGCAFFQQKFSIPTASGNLRSRSSPSDSHPWYPNPWSPPSPYPYPKPGVPVWLSSAESVMCSSGSSTPIDSAPKSLSTSNLGTGFGERTKHEVTTVTFDREDNPAEIIVIGYDDVEGLKTRGVVLDRAPAIASPFPADPAPIGCPPPPGWKG